MASNSDRRSGSSASSKKKRKRVVIGAQQTTRVRYRHEQDGDARTSGQTRRTSGTSGRPKAAPVGPRLADAKRREREHRQRLVRIRGGAIAVALLVGAVLLAWGLVSLYRAPIFPVREITVSGAVHHDRADVLAIAQVPSDATLLRLPARRIEASLTADPWISSAQVRRDFPGTVRIVVTERRAGAVVDAGGASVLVVSEDGYWLGPWTSDDEGLVEIKDVEEIEASPGARLANPEVSNALRVINGLSPRLRKAVAFVSAPTVDETAVVTRKDVEIFFGEAVQMGEKSRIVEEILDQNDGVVYINVRVTDRPTWRGLGGS